MGMTDGRDSLIHSTNICEVLTWETFIHLGVDSTWSHISLDYLMRVSELSSCSSGPWLPLHFHLDFLSPLLCHPSGQQNLHQAEPANIPASGSQQPSLTSCFARTCVTGVAICMLREGRGWGLWVSLCVTPRKGSACPLSEHPAALLVAEPFSQNRKCL